MTIHDSKIYKKKILGICVLKRFLFHPVVRSCLPVNPVTCYFQKDENRQHVEVCPEGGVIVQKLANRIADDGGAALIVDYGHDGTKTDTFRVSAI